MDNQHATLELAWLGGMFDGEGSILIRRNAPRPHETMSPRWSISNTDPVIIARVQMILRKVGINPYVYEQDRAEHKKVCFHIQVNKKSQVKQILECLMPYVFGKKTRCQMVLDWLNEQTDQNSAFAALKILNQRGRQSSEPSETTREATA
jgi:hypothetical protein